MFTFCISDVAAAQVGSDNATVMSDNLTVSQTISNSGNSTTDNISSFSDSKKSHTLPDPVIYNGGVPVSRGGQTAGYNWGSIQNAINNAQSGDTIMLENGATFYEHDLVISKNLDFNVLGGGHATIDAQGQGRLFMINNGVTVNLYNLTLQNGYVSGGNGGAIYNNGTLTVTGSTFTNNIALKSVPPGGGYVIGGSGGAIYNNGYLTVISSTFVGNTANNGGGAIENAGTSTVIRSTFANNQAPCGGAITNPNTCILTVTDSIFNNNAAEEEGGAIYNFGGTLTVTGSTFTGNVLTNLLSGNLIFGGSAISNVFGNSAQVHFNRIVGNSLRGGEISSIGAVMNATFNWWGFNSSPAGEIASKYGGTVLFDPWIILTVTANPTTINLGGTSQITADLLHDSSLAHTYHNPADGHVPDGIPITLTLSSVWGTLTNIVPSSSTTLNGEVEAIYHTGSLPIQTPVRVYASLDGGQVYTDINVPIPTTLTVNSPKGYNDNTVNIIATLTRTDTGTAVIGKPVTIIVNGQTYTGNTDSNGQITWSYIINNMDAKDYTITATFAGDTQYIASNSQGTLTVRKIPTDLSLYIPWGNYYNGNTVNITATLKRYDTNTGVPVADKPVTITLNGQTYSGNTDASGQLTWTYIINNMDAKGYDIFATFAGDTQYIASNDQDTLTVRKIPTSLTVSNAGGVGSFKGQTVNILATLIDTVHDNSPVSGKQIDFYVNNVLVPGGPVFTNASGVVTLVYQIAQDAGIYSIHVVFAGDNQYLTSTSNPDGTLTVDKIPTNVTVTHVHNFAGQNVTLTANVTDYYGHSINEGSMKFTVNGSYVGTVPVNNGEVTLNWTIPSDWNTGNYIILAEYLGTGNSNASNSTGNLTVDATPTSITVGNVTGINTKTVSLNATLTDAYGHPLTGKTINFKINGKNVGNGTTDSNGIAALNYKLNSAGNFTVTAEFAGDREYVNSTSNGTLTVDPSSDLYIIITSNKNNQKVDETFTLTYKLGNNGPDAAQNVTITIPLPEGFEVSQITGGGKWTYNSATRTITWTLENVPVGDPYLYITGKVLRSGSYVFDSSISSETYNIDSKGVTEVTINAVSQVHAASKTSKKVKAIPLQHTGLPLAGIILAVLAVCGGLITSKRK